MIIKKVDLNTYHAHDREMSSIEGVLYSLYDLGYLEYCDSKQYREMSKAIYQFYEALENGTLEEGES